MTELATDGGTTVEASFEPGDRVTDADENEDERAAMRVLRRTDDRADKHVIDALPGSLTVADVNDRYPASDTVLINAFESALTRHLPGWQNDLDSPEEEDLETRFEQAGGTLYSYPESRVKPVSEDWDPPAGADGRTSGQRERDDVFGGYSADVKAFLRTARRVFENPETAADDLAETFVLPPNITDEVANAVAVFDDHLQPGEPAVEAEPGPKAPKRAFKPVRESRPPDTRGECRHTRSDTYRPEDRAIVCWHCSDRPHNRPEKFWTSDDAGDSCTHLVTTGHTLRPRVLRQTVRESARLVPPELPQRLGDVYGPNDDWTIQRFITRLRSDNGDWIRKAALRVSYEATLSHVEEYNYNRALALLRDHGVARELPIIGEGHRESEA